MNSLIRISIILSLIFIVNSSFAINNSDTSLTSCGQLKDKINQENYKLIDLRKPEEFKKGHLPGAINIWRPEIINQNESYGGMMAKKETIEKLFSNLGVKNTDRLVIYDNKGLCDAARLWWILDYYGFKQVKLLNGGLNQWLKEKLPISTEINSYPKTTFSFPSKTVNKSRYASINYVKKAINNPNSFILDTRELDEYTGEFLKKGAYRKGRIPTSLWCNWSKTVDYRKNTQLKSIDRLKKIYKKLGLTPDKEIIVYCQSGVRSAHTTFVLTQLLGYTNVKNYDGSWIEWSYFKENPVETGAIAKPVAAKKTIKTTTQKSYSDVFLNAYKNYPKYIWNEITLSVSTWYKNYFWLLVVLSIVVWLLEIIFPWRKNQPIIRKDFFLDAFYMFFNFFLFKIIIFYAFSVLIEQWFGNLIGGIDKLIIYDTSQLHPIVQLIVFFVALDFIQWFTHVLLHRFEFLWKFHKVHHSVEQMGFAAHFRFHWMENVFYTPMKFLIMMVIGNFGPENAFIVYYITIAIGHLNHANIGLSYGPLKYLINNPKMHIWHHAHDLPEKHKHGANFGISLSIWDYMFKTAYIPHSGRDIKLGFENLKQFPKGFFKQLVYGFAKK